MILIFSPLKFIKVSYPGRIYHAFVIPTIFTSAVIIAVFIYPKHIRILGDGGIIDSLLSILPVLGGFFIAALTVIVSQDHPLLKEGMAGSHKPIIPGEGEPLTRIRFLSLLFGYLSFSSFFLMGIAFLAKALAPAMYKDMTMISWNITKFLFLIIVFYWLAHMFSATMIGLHYFSDRLYRASGKAEFSKELPPPPP